MSITDKINRLLNSEVNPKLAAHNGAAHVSYIEDDIVYIKMTGACAGCAYAAGDVSKMIESAVKKDFPEIHAVRLDDSIDSDIIDFAKRLLSKKT